MLKRLEAPGAADRAWRCTRGVIPAVSSGAWPRPRPLNSQQQRQQTLHPKLGHTVSCIGALGQGSGATPPPRRPSRPATQPGVLGL
ncbi:hypothetical protein HYH03_009021 [Edaphochlamys debaryana]|uniref:Uncharacterized protein n=1 Tax=Edaphochlamys debaryana TaxID=47281 RepID=A0A835Y4Z1_9CHLO|nr:hypothetical protein HYH03_009021 [Edaphochlamys debaryana]|eukprot:KAG2492605.1 hypothetical protein HYH03_009021 [Edaphochlamys debaryana]